MEYLSPIVILVGIIIIAFLLWNYITGQYGSSVEGMKSVDGKSGMQLSQQSQMDQMTEKDQLNQMYQMDQTGQMNSMNPEAMMAMDYRTPAFSQINSRTVAAAKASCVSMEPTTMMVDQPDGSIQKDGGDYKIPMNDDLNGSLPMAMLPSKVGTFHPTYACDRFICNGCEPSSCHVAKGAEGRKLMTDDQGRNYIADIEKIRDASNAQFPTYNLS